MAVSTNVSRRPNGTYSFRRTLDLGNGNQIRSRVSLRTRLKREATFRAAALNVHLEVFQLRMKMDDQFTGLSATERAEVYRHELLRARDNLAVTRADLQSRGDVEESRSYLTDALDAQEALHAEMAVAGVPLEWGNPSATISRFPQLSDGALQLILYDVANPPFYGSEDYKEVAIAALESIGVSPTELKVQQAQIAYHDAVRKAVQEVRAALLDPSAGYPDVPVAGFGPTLPALPVAMPAPAVTPPLADASAVDETMLPAEIARAAEVRRFASMTATEAANTYMAMNPRTGGQAGEVKGTEEWESWTGKTRNQFLVAVSLLEEVLDGRPLSAVTDDDILELDRLFGQLHGPTFRKSPRQRAMTMRDIAAEVASDRAAGKGSITKVGLGLTTTNRHFGFLRLLITWLGKKCPVLDIDFEAVIKKDKRSRRTRRDAYTVDEAKAVFSLPIFTGAAGVTKRLVVGKLIVHDAGYWVLILCWYTGFRREEVCALEIDDLQCDDDGNWFFILRDTATGRLKNQQSARVLPVADELIRLGLIRYRDALAAEGETLLFPELRGESGKGTLGDRFYKLWWTKISPHLDFLEPGQAVHSFRHSFASELKFADVELETRADMLGHALRGADGGDLLQGHAARAPPGADQAHPGRDRPSADAQAHPAAAGLAAPAAPRASFQEDLAAGPPCRWRGKGLTSG